MVKTYYPYRRSLHQIIKTGKKQEPAGKSPKIPFPGRTQEKISQVVEMEKIIEFYNRNGWETFGLKRPSISSIARALSRKGITAIRYEQSILPLLKRLQNEGKIKLPPKTKSGGARKKKQ